MDATEFQQEFLSSSERPLVFPEDATEIVKTIS